MPAFWRLFALLFVLIDVGVSPALGQQQGATILGTVHSADGRQVLPMANAFVEGTRLGASTDAAGSFHIMGIPPGKVVVAVRLLGYNLWRSDTLQLSEGDTVRINVRLTETAIAMREVQVTAERERRRNDIRASVLDIAPTRSKTLPGVAEDVMRSLQAMPGVLATSDFTAQLVVRGSSPDQNLILMDGIEIFNPYRLYGMISMFNPETASNITLITGGFPAKYGDRLSAVLDVTNREGDRTSPLKANTNISITNANLVLGGALPFGIPGSYLLSTRRTYYDLILAPFAKKAGLVSGDVAFPNFFDVQAKIVIEPQQGHKIVFSGLFSRDGVDLISGSNRTTPDSISVLDRTHNDVAGIAWHYSPTSTFFSKLGVSWYRNSGDTEFGGDFVDPSLDRSKFANGDTTGLRLYNVAFTSQYRFGKVTVKEELGWALPGHIIESGFQGDMVSTDLIWHFHPDSTFQAILAARNIASMDDFVQSNQYPRIATYVQDKITVTDALAIQPGLRLDYYEILNKSYLQPRINLLFKMDPVSTVRAAWGTYRQSPGYEKLLDQNAFIDLSHMPSGRLAAEGATHYVLGIDRWLDEEWQIKVEGYYKTFTDIIVQKIVPGTVVHADLLPGADPRLPSSWTTPVSSQGDSLTTLPINGAYGSSYGIEVTLQKINLDPESPLNGWIGYSYAEAYRIRDGVRTPFRFDQRHTVDVVLDYRLSSWLTLGLRWKFGSGFPYNEPVGTTPRIVMSGTGGKAHPEIQYDRFGHVVFDIDRGGELNKYNGRLPAYHRLDARLSAKAGYWGWDWDFYLDVINVYNRGNVFNYRLFVNDDLSVGRSTVTMLPIIPTLGVSIRF